MKNRAVVFIKPHAMNGKTIRFVEDFLAANRVVITGRGELTAEEIDSREIVDRHYFAIAHTAVQLTPSRYAMTDDARKKFREAFGEDWKTALDTGKIRNSKELMAARGLSTGMDLQSLWLAGSQAKLGPGFYAGKLDDGSYVINGFYPAMREKFTAAGGRIGWYTVEFDPEALSWKRFRGEVIGATDPVKAADGSLRKLLLERYRELGQSIEPSMSNNGVHASAGPVEGLKEMEVWTGADVESQELARMLRAGGMTGERLRELLQNGPVTVNGKTGPVYDLTEDMDTPDVVRALGGKPV